jgi:hypothetical protein
MLYSINVFKIHAENTNANANTNNGDVMEGGRHRKQLKTVQMTRKQTKEKIKKLRKQRNAARY